MRNLILRGTILILLLQADPQSKFLKTELPVSDKSSAGAPLQAAGNATASSEITDKGIESTAQLTARLKNISTKPILAFEAITDLSPSYVGGDRMTSHHDFFFSDSLLTPGSSTEIAIAPHKEIVFWNRAEHPANFEDIHQPSQARAEVKVTFVQFADGTTFGASQWSRTLTAERENMMAIMGGLLLAYDADREAGLKSAIEKELAKPEIPNVVFSSLGMIQQKFREAGATLTVQYLRDCLANAQRRSNLLGATTY
jgi:hypothetical protein